MSGDRTLDLADDVRQGLDASPKRLPARLFYDADGSALFEEITRLPEYYLTRTELGLFERYAREMMARAGDELTVIELGVGSAFKTRVLLRALLAQQKRATFVPVDVSRAALEMTVAALQPEFPTLQIIPMEGRYRRALDAVNLRSGRRLVLFIGSSVGNFDPEEATALLEDLRAGLTSGDALLLGTDLRKDPALLHAAYDDAQGVTARFNKNVLARINRELGGTFALEQFAHLALWNDAASRMEMHLESLSDQTVRIDALGRTYNFVRGERIHTENSHKFTVDSVRELLGACGFALEHTWTDERNWFAEHLARAV